ncbi:MAG: hypothetical protein JO112_08815 [Planctomycetes bacterium]|nr:hypothetical protein [Planctomycetota bacterium]
MMTNKDFEQTIRGLLQRQPFQPFLIEFEDGSRFVVGQPEALMYQGGGTAIFIHPDGAFDFVDSEGVNRFIELTEAPST